MITIYRNRAYLLMENLLSLSFLSIFILSLYIALASFNIVEKKIDEKRKLEKVIQILENMRSVVSNSKKKKLLSNVIYLDKQKIYLEKNGIYAKKANGKNRFKILEANDIEYIVRDKLLIIKTHNIYRMISIRWKIKGQV